jgi:hypothetical protein
MTLEEDDELFEYVMKQVRIGRDWEDYVAESLCRVGIPAKASNAPVIPTRNEREWNEMADEKDITVDGRFRLEAKSREYRFSGVDDFPFPTAMVSTVRSWANKVQRPLAVAMVSQFTGAIIFAPEWTEPEWSQKSRFDRKRGYWVNNWECPRKLLWTWDSYVEFLHGYLLESA